VRKGLGRETEPQEAASAWDTAMWVATAATRGRAGAADEGRQLGE
jgi:hypothetical protein